MRRCFLIARSNICRAKGQAAAIIVLMMLAALMLNLWLMLSTDYKQNFDRCHDRLNAEHVTLAVDSKETGMQKMLTQTLESDENVIGFSLDDSMQMVGLFEYNGGEFNSKLVFLEKEAAVSRTVGRIEIVEDSDIDSGVYMPMLYKSDKIAIGEEMELSIGSNKISYPVCGFFNSVMTGSHNCAMCAIILTEDRYKELAETGYAPEAMLCSVRLRDKAESEDYEAKLKNIAAAYDPAARLTSNSYALVSKSRYISQMICSGIMSAMAFLILLIALIVMASNIVSYIQENMKDLGALKALGYTSRQLMYSLLLQFLGLSLFAAAAGVGISYVLFPFLNSMMIAQTGIPYSIHFLPLQMAITLMVLEGAVAAVVWISSRRIRKVDPIAALREGILTHNFKRNHVRLEQARVPLNFALALKTAMSGMKYNIAVCITVLVLSLVLVFSGLMEEHVINNIEPFINLVVGETADSAINISVAAEEDFLQELRNDARVEKAYLYNSCEVRQVGSIALLATMTDDFEEINNKNVVFEGRFPKFDNEVAIAGKYAGEHGIQIGDEITLTAEGKEAGYIVSGFTQISDNLGKDCLFTRRGYERLGELQAVTYYLNLADGVSVEDFNSDMQERFGNNVNLAVNIEMTIMGAASVYVALMKIIVVAILMLSAVVVAFVLYLLVRTMLNAKKRDYGIQKALGFTTGQLVIQTALSFMPAIILSTVIGVSVCSFIINPLMSLFLRGIGIVKCTFTVPVGFIALEGAGLILFAFAVLCLLSLKIKRIAPRELLMGE